MIFRKYRTLIFALIVLVCVVVGYRVLPYLNAIPMLQGVAQGTGAGYPLRSVDRTLVDLNGTWQSFKSMGAAEAAFALSVRKDVYSVEEAVYDTVKVDREVSVPGSWDSSVVVRQFQLGNDLSGRNFRLHFLGTGGPIEIFVNGFSPAESVGRIEGGSVPAFVDIPAPRFRFGQRNTIAIKLKNPQASGSWVTFPGLTGEVYLEALGSIELDNPVLATRLNGDGSAELSYSIPVSVNGNGGKLSGQVTLIDGSGNVTAAHSHDLKNGPQTVLTGKLPVPQPRLWSTGDPYLYRLEVFVNAESGERDSYFLPVGLRELEFNGGLELNGKKFEPKILLRVSDFLGGAGSADATALETEIKWAKDKGYNTWYLPDRPPHPYLLDLADRYGLLVFSQAPAGRAEAAERWQTTLGEVTGVKQKLGFHPSFAGQGLGSELDLLNPAAQDYLQQASGLGRVFYTVLGKPDQLLFAGGGEQQLNAPYLADFVAVKPSFSGSGFVQTHLNRSGIITRERSEKGQEPPGQAKAEIPPYVPLAVGGIALVLMLQTWQLDNLRFSNLAEAKPKRKLRRQIRQQACWYLLRLSVLALIPAQLAGMYDSGPLTDYFIESIPMHSLQVLAWYLLANPWDLFLVLFCAGTLLSLILTWPRARSLPGRPGTIATILWLEKRKRWIVLAMGAWVLASYGGPYWLVWAVLGGGYVLSRFSVGKDVRWAGGKTYNLIYFVCFLVIALGILLTSWEVLKYIYHWSIV